jgi:hypothetical protein
VRRRSSKKLKILLKTDHQGKLEIIDRDSGQKLDGFSNIQIYINTYGRVCVVLEIKDVGLELKLESKEIHDAISHHKCPKGHMHI